MRKLVAASLIIGSLAGAGGSVGFAIATAATPHSGSIPSAVNTSIEGGGMGGPGGMGRNAGGGNHGTASGQTSQNQQGESQNQQGQTKENAGQAGGGRMGGGMGGDISSNTELVKLLKSTGTRWAAATNGSQSAAGIEIATEKSVMAIGGWSGDPAPTLDEFIAYVKAGKISYYIGGGQGGPGGNSEISTWVAKNYTAMTVGGTTVYKLI